MKQCKKLKKHKNRQRTARSKQYSLFLSDSASFKFSLVRCPGCQKISIRGFPGFASSTEASSRTQEKTSGAKNIGPRVKFIILNIFSESNLYDDLKFPPKIAFLFRGYHDAQLRFWLIHLLDSFCFGFFHVYKLFLNFFCSPLFITVSFKESVENSIFKSNIAYNIFCRTLFSACCTCSLL